MDSLDVKGGVPVWNIDEGRYPRYSFYYDTFFIFVSYK